MVYVVIFLLMLIALAVVAYPLLRPVSEPSAQATDADMALEELLSQRDATYAAIKELEFEHQLGNLSAQDYQELREQYRRKAARLLQQIESSVQAGPAPAVAAPATSPEDEIEAAVRRLRQRQQRAAVARACPLCGETVAANDRYCGNCGATMARFCPGCGEAREPGDRFCRMCGTPLEAQA